MPIPAKLGRYEIIKKLGFSGLSEIYLARDFSTNRQVIIKRLREQDISSREMLFRFKQEAQLLARLENAPIVPIFELNDLDEQLFIVMRYMAGGSLQDLLDLGALPLEKIIPIIARVAKALDIAHRNKIIHRDVKPSNILFDENGDAFLADFGLSKDLGASIPLTQSGGLVGTPLYMSPEQITNPQNIDERSDIYSLGVILYKMLTGMHPFESQLDLSNIHLVLDAIMEKDIPLLTKDKLKKLGLPPQCNQILKKALAKNRNERYASAGDLAKDVARLSFSFVSATYKQTSATVSVTQGSTYWLANKLDNFIFGGVASKYQFTRRLLPWSRTLILIFGFVIVAATTQLILTIRQSQVEHPVLPTLTNTSSSPVPTSTPTLRFTDTPQPTFTATPKLTYSPTPAPTPTHQPYWWIETFQEKRGDSLFWMVTSVTGLFFTYLFSISALIVNARNKGSAFFSRSWLTTIASKPLFISPGIGKWFLFLGYRTRLQNHEDVISASKVFYGVPGIDSNGKKILPDANGFGIIKAISEVLAPQTPIVIEANGGCGKTTLLARLCYLALNEELPPQLNGYQPILVTPAYYDGNLIAAIANVLRERDAVAIDRKMVQAQLETGKYLVLFDGVSEIFKDQDKGLQEILRKASNADYRNCRFIISTRPGLNVHPTINVFRLQPLSSDAVLQLMHLYQMSNEQKYHFKRQVTMFGSKPIEPLLLKIITEQNKKNVFSSTRAELFDGYFRTQLQVTDDIVWNGWKIVLGEIANWFILGTGRRGIGMMHERLVDMIAGKFEDKDASSVIERSRKYYRLPVESELDILERLQGAAILQLNKRWQFVHDTYEEYFVAWHIILCLINNGKLPDLSFWTLDENQTKSFVSVFEFVREIEDEETKKILMSSDLPSLWKEILTTSLDG